MNSFLRNARHLLAPLLIIAFMGQTLAAVGAPCPMMDTNAADIMAGMHGMDHSSHDTGDWQAADSIDNSCCEGDGFCSMSNCLSAAALPGSATIPKIVHARAFGDWPTLASSLPAPESLYRPPISR